MYIMMKINYLFTEHKISKNKENIELRCKNRNSWKRRAKFSEANEIIMITYPRTIKYKEHNYEKSEIFREKEKINTSSNEKMNQYEYQKINLIEANSQYLL